MHAITQSLSFPARLEALWCCVIMYMEIVSGEAMGSQRRRVLSVCIVCKSESTQDTFSKVENAAIMQMKPNSN